MAKSKTYSSTDIPTVLPDGNDGFESCPNLLTEDELISFLRIPQISKAKHYYNVIAHLKRCRNLPCIHICHQPLYPRQAILDWIKVTTQKEMTR